MSAFIVSKRHIDALVTALIQDGAPASEADEIGHILWHENHRSVNARYSEDTRTPLYRYKPLALSRIAVLKAIDCYEYQSCEHSGWDDSTARALMLKLSTALENYYTGNPRETKEYEDAAWGIAGRGSAP